MSAILLYTSDCRSCSYLLLSPTPTVVCPRCNSADNCTPPTPIYVSPQRPYDFDYDAEEYQRTLDASFEEAARDVEPRPASEQTLQAMRKIVLTGEDLQGPKQCGICLEQLVPGDEAVLTPCCSQYAHGECMEKALVVTPCCPYCRWSAH